MGLQHSQYSVVLNNLTTYFDPANGSSMVSNKKNLMYLEESNPLNYYRSRGSVIYDSSNQAILWDNELYESWGAFIRNGSVFNYSLDTAKQYTASFECKIEGGSLNNMSFEIADDPDIYNVVIANVGANSTLLPTGWYKFTYTFTPSVSGRNAFFRVIHGYPRATRVKFWWRNLQVEEGVTATTYASGVISNILFDISGNSMHATIPSPAYDSLNGGSLYLDGTTMYVDTNNRYLSKYNSGTISMWVKSRDVSKVNHFYYESDSGDGFGGEPEISLTINGGVVTAWIPYGGLNVSGFINSFWNSNGFAVSNNVWFNATLTYSFLSDNSQGTFNFYMNGQANGSGTIPIPYRSFTQNALLGRPRYSLDSRSLTGSLGAFMFYDKVLSATEVLSNYNALKGRYGL